jgi:hypothetical protein
MTGLKLCSLILLAVLSANSAATAQDGSQYRDRIQAFLTRPDQAGLQSQLLVKAWGNSAGPCKSVNITRESLFYLTPITFDDRGTPLSGSWKHTIAAAGCGISRTLNLFYTADGSGNVNRFAGAPGTTGADLILQQDSIPHVLAGASPFIARDCKQIQLIDTEYVGTEPDPVPGSKGSPWRERWTLSGCGAGARVTLHFIPEPAGTRISVNPAETQRVDAK